MSVLKRKSLLSVDVNDPVKVVMFVLKFQSGQWSHGVMALRLLIGIITVTDNFMHLGRSVVVLKCIKNQA